MVVNRILKNGKKSLALALHDISEPALEALLLVCQAASISTIEFFIEPSKRFNKRRIKIHYLFYAKQYVE